MSITSDDFYIDLGEYLGESVVLERISHQLRPALGVLRARLRARRARI
jgi:hypothetical protein